MFWNIVYPNFSYLYPAALENLFIKCGLKVLEVKPQFDDDQYLSIEAGRYDSELELKATAFKSVGSIVKDIEIFALKYKKKLKTINNTLNKIAIESDTIAAWGAGARIINFLK